MSSMLSTLLMLPLITQLFSGASAGGGMSSLLPLMLLGGGSSMSSLLPLMLLSGSGTSGDALSTIAPVMVAQKVLKPTRRYRRRRNSTASRLAYLSGVVSALKARG